MFVATVGAGIASSGRGPAPLSGLAAAQAAALRGGSSSQAPAAGKSSPAPAGKNRPPADYDYDYAAPPAGKAGPVAGKGAPVAPGKAAPAAAGKATAGKAAPVGKATGKNVIMRTPPKAQSNILPAQAAVLKPKNVTVPTGPNDYDYDYVTTDQGQKIPKCICPHEWQPVCGLVNQQGLVSRVTFSNRCQALCRSNNISLGVCPGDSEVYEKCYFDNCRADDVNPICVNNTDFANPCTATCRFAAMGLPPPPYDAMASGPCYSECAKNKTVCPADRLCWPKPGACFKPPCLNYRCVDPTCANPDKCGPKKFNYVCANGITYTNRCWAKCEGYDKGVKKGVCPDGQRDPWFPRVIPYDPIAQGLPDPLAKPTPAVAPLQCVPGLYLNGTSCLPCPSGFTSTPAATNCTPCPAGAYAGVRASPQCTPCPNGTFTGTVGSSTCQACTPPFVTLKPGSVSCQLPPLSMYGRSTVDCNVNDPCQCAQLVGDCGWSSSYSKCMKDKDTDCKECPKMNVCRDLVNATDASRKPPAVRDLAVTESQAQLLKAQWVQPIKNFICNVDMYKVQLRKEDGPWQLIEWPSFGIYGIDPVISIGGLSPATGYTIMVTPVSLSGGEGPSSQVPARTAKI